MRKQDTISTLDFMAKTVKKSTKIKRGFAVANSHLEFLTIDGKWSTESTKAHIMFERVAVAKAEEVHGKVTHIEVLVS